MSRTYQTLGIVVKGMAFGESDRLVTIFSPEYGLIRAIAPGARKPKSSLRGRTELFVVNQFLLFAGKSLDRINQAETQYSYPGLGQNVCNLAAGQYLIELILALGTEASAQTSLYELFTEHLRRLETEATAENIYGHLAQALFHCLGAEGFAPQFHHCAITAQTISPNFYDRQWRVGFSPELGGIVDLRSPRDIGPIPQMRRLTAMELSLLQQLNQPALPDPQQYLPAIARKNFRLWDWVKAENLMRYYAQRQLGKSFRAAVLLDSMWEVDF